MQLLPCPFCGEREEREFHFAGEMGKVRPKTESDVSDAEWSTYLHSQSNEKGRVREVWCHLPCQEYFLMERDTVTMEVLDSTALRKEPS